MNPIIESFEPTAQTIVPALLNSFWQGALLAALVWGLLKTLRRVNAATAGLVWWTVLLVVTLLPVANAWHQHSHAISQTFPPLARATKPLNEAPPAPLSPLPPPALAMQTPVPPTVTSLPVANPTEVPSVSTVTPVATPENLLPASSIVRPPAPTPLPPLNSAVTAAQPTRRIEIVAGLWATMLLLAWGLCGGVLLFRLLLGWRQLLRLKRQARPAPTQRFKQLVACLEMKRTVRLGISDQITTPLAAGLRNPMVLLPANLMEELTEAEFDAVVIHELAHLRRWDDWSNLLLQTLQAVLWLNPVVWLVGRQIGLQREIACDDWVIATTGQPKDYATCLTRLMELARPPRLTLPAPGAWMTRSQLSRRVLALLDKRRNVTTRGSMAWTGITVALLIGITLGMFQWAPAIAFAAEPPPKAAAPPPVVPNAPKPPEVPNLPVAPVAKQPSVSNLKLPTPDNVAKFAIKGISSIEGNVSATLITEKPGAGDELVTLRIGDKLGGLELVALDKKSDTVVLRSAVRELTITGGKGGEPAHMTLKDFAGAAAGGRSEGQMISSKPCQKSKSRRI